MSRWPHPPLVCENMPGVLSFMQYTPPDRNDPNYHAKRAHYRQWLDSLASLEKRAFDAAYAAGPPPYQSPSKANDWAARAIAGTAIVTLPATLLIALGAGAIFVCGACVVGPLWMAYHAFIKQDV